MSERRGSRVLSSISNAEMRRASGSISVTPVMISAADGQARKRRVAVTGIGLLTALGVGVEDNWSALAAGRSGVAPIGTYDASSLRSQLGAEITALKPRDFVDRRALRNMTRYDMLATVAGVLAMRDSGLALEEDPDGRYGLFTASGKEISEPEHFQDVAVAVRDDDGKVDLRKFGELAFEQVHPLFYIEGLQGASLFYLSDAFPLRGANTFFAGGPEAGLTAVGRAFRAIRRGEADIVLAGAADAPVCWWNMAKIDAIGLTTPHNELEHEACRPYDRERDGTVMGEGGAFLVLEEYEAARARGARVYAEITGFGTTTDIEHLLAPDPQGRPLADAITRALREAGAAPDDVDYVAGSGTGSLACDASEGRALGAVFASNGSTHASSITAATGHLGAAAGSANAAVAALAIARQTMPPTLNLQAPDPACEGIEWLAGGARQAPVGVALALARGLEGQNVALALRAVDQEEHR
jgi:3-oxoacyl-[acyl-carrier-protein] synthase II